MADRKSLDDEAMEKLLAEAAREAPQPSGQLLERIMADAEAVAARGEAQPAPCAPHRLRGGRLARLLAALGGWPALAGLATAAVAGVWLGLAPPPGLEAIARGVPLPFVGGEYYAVEDFMPSLDDMLTEG